MALGKTLKALRQKQSLNQKALSALSGVSQATISRIETGRVKQLRSSALKNLADALGASVDFLMGDNEVFANIPSPGSQNAGSIPGVREDRFRQIADTLDAFVVHEEGRILYVNQTFADMLGYRKEELLGKNGIDLVTAPQSRNLVQRMIGIVSSEAYEALLVRRDGTLFPSEMTSKSINENVHLAVVRDISARRCQQAVSRVQQAGLEAEKLSDMARVIRIMCDEVEDLGLPFDAIGINIIDEEGDRLISYSAYPESRGYRSFQDTLSLQEALERYAPVRGLVSNWRRNKVWEREADAEFTEMIRQSSMDTSYSPALIIDIPFVQGTLFLGLPPAPSVRVDDGVTLLRALSQPLSCILKRLQQTEVLLTQLQEAKKEHPLA